MCGDMEDTNHIFFKHAIWLGYRGAQLGSYGAMLETRLGLQMFTFWSWDL
jgi:hypothetical protein